MLPTPCTLRRANLHDAAALSAFAARLFPLGGRLDANPADVARHIESELTPSRFREHIANPNSILTLAECDGVIVGFAMLMLRNPHAAVPFAASAEVRKFYVDPAHHGSGLANLLMQAIVEQLSPGTECVWLSVFSENPRAMAFYQRWGFEIVGKQYFHVGGDAQQDYVMVRRERDRVAREAAPLV